MPTIDGLLLVDKPAGCTSHDVVAIARRALGRSRVGHGGTLDPFATGLLVLLVGRATRLLPYLEGEPKVYAATIRLGAETDTDDGTGATVRTAPLPDRAAVERAMRGLTGDVAQTPPAYSAKQVAGQRAHAAARRGAPLALAPATVTVHDWATQAWRDDEVDVTVTCSGGTYVRALARDVGRAAGSAAHLTALRRLRSGPFDVAGAATLDAVRAGTAAMLPPLAAVPSLTVVTLDADSVRHVRQGRDVPAGESAPGADRAALVDQTGALVAIAQRNGDWWHPRTVLADD
ncbi:MAG TPA: tRNA pseudouridine(55) synthase TruB [Gemmatimonadaceae bacterium]|nr:tRNA pseudouridine(55) synthase TruB [Gemmatimonadaceae bacterium]